MLIIVVGVMSIHQLDASFASSKNILSYHTLTHSLKFHHALSEFSFSFSVSVSDVSTYQYVFICFTYEELTIAVQSGKWRRIYKERACMHNLQYSD